MPFLAEPSTTARPRILVINPNSTEAFTRSMQQALTDAGLTSGSIGINYYTAPADTAPASIEGTYDSVISAAAVLNDLKGRWDDWDGYVVACFSAHPLVPAIRELTPSPAVGILEAPLLLASQLSPAVGILTTSPGWVPILEHDLHILHLSAKCTAGVITSGMKVLELETLPKQQVLDTLGRMASEELVQKRGAGAVVLGCAGMAGLKGEVEKACGKGLTVIDPVECGVELCMSLVRLRRKGP